MVAFVALGAVVLCVTGGEALYADMGHFGRRPIRIAWYGFVMPALVVNYFGSFDSTWAQLHHHRDHMTCADMIAPLFMFVVGMGMRLSMARRRSAPSASSEGGLAR